MAEWAVKHPGIGRLRYDSARDAVVAAGTAGVVQTRDGEGDEWRDVPADASQFAEAMR
jgi:N-acyl-D-aspartate/D-glutamate deacylase